MCNADLRIGEIHQFCELPEDAQSRMWAVRSQLNLSARAYPTRAHDRPSRQAEEIQSADLPEALQYPPNLGLS
jgi:hypothetical protein